MKRLFSWIRYECLEQGQLYLEGLLDYRRFYQASTIPHRGLMHQQKHLESDIVRRYHILEKGLSMPDFRPRFGLTALRELQDLLEKFAGSGFVEEGNQIAVAREVVRQYYKRHAELGIDVNDIIDPEYTGRGSSKEKISGGTKLIEHLRQAEIDGFLKVVKARSSVRNFQENKIPERIKIERALECAIRTPSSCNRQPWRIHYFTGEKAQKLLALQTGNAGFGKKIPALLVLTVDMTYYTGVFERYQAWVDGGMFAMTLLLGLHAESLGAVALNWAVKNAKDKTFRKRAGIPDTERIVMLVGCGYPAKNALVATSTRREVGDFVTWNDG